jgi:hypothetical protein
LSFFRQKGKKLILLIAAMAVGSVAWQNCARVDLQANPSTMPAQGLDLSASICPKISSQGTSTENFLFIVDMSASNIGAWFNVGSFWYWDKTKATDYTGARFQAITYFLNNCGNQSNAKFAVVAFSDGAGQIAGSGSTAKLNCTGVTFGTSQQAQAQLTALAQAQTAETGWYEQWTQSTNNYLTSLADQPPIVRGTSYTNALSCADQIVVNDLTQASGPTAEKYQVVFISDGSPGDEPGIGCNLKSSTPAQIQQCYLDSVDTLAGHMRQAALALGRDLRISGVFYGQAEQGVPVAMTRLAVDGATGAPMDLTSFQGNAGALCSFLSAELNVEYAPDSMMAVNLTTIKKGKNFLADSDMDGIPDIDEAGLGYDPANPRSQVSGVLDGICERLGGLAKCQQMRSQITCDPTLFYNYLTDCDVKILNLYNPTLLTQGLDTDGDTLLDFIEIVKGTDPSVGDAAGDPDSDGITNQFEIAQGTDPFTVDSDTDPRLLTKFTSSFQANLPVCSQGGGWKMGVTQTSTSPTQVVSSFPANLNALNHAAGDQVIWMGYRMVAMNGSNNTNQYYGKIVTVHVNPDGTVQLSSGGSSAVTSSAQLMGTDFSLLGNASP